MNFKIIFTVLMSFSLFSCAQESPKIKHKTKTTASNSKTKTVKFANSIDPICDMKTEPDMKHTAIYKNKTYGFCSSYCKDEFNKDPEKYVQK